MEAVEGKIQIDAVPANVMAVLADFSTYPQWSGFNLTEVRDTDASGRASRVYIELAAGPVNAKYEIAIEYLPGDGGLRWTFAGGSGITDTEGEYRLESEGDATIVHYRGAADMNLPMPGFMKRKLIEQGQKIGRDKALSGLKRFVESGE